MSQFKGHLAGGAAAFAIYLAVLVLFFAYRPQADVFVWFGLSILGATWPDVDTNSTAQKLFYGVFIVIDAYLIMTGRYRDASIFGLLALLPVLSKHRGWTHSIAAALLIPSPLLILPLIVPGLDAGGLEYYVPTTLGYLSHLALDRQLKLI